MRHKHIITNTSRWVRAPISGLVQPLENIISKAVKKNQLLGYIHDPSLINPSTKIIAPFDGIVIGMAMKAITNEGDGLFHIASFKKLSGVSAYIDEIREELTSHE